MLRNIPEDPQAREEMIQIRHTRKDHLLSVIGRTHEQAEHALGGLSSTERLPLQNAQERKTIECIGRLKSHAQILDGTTLFSDPATSQASSRDGDAIEQLYILSGFAESHPHVMASARRCRLYAEEISRALQGTRFSSQISPEAMGVAGMMRNVASFFDEKGYHRRSIVAEHTWQELGIHEAYRNVLRPLSVDAGPIRSSEYQHTENRNIHALM